MATSVGGMHPTGMHSCFELNSEGKCHFFDEDFFKNCDGKF